MDRRTFVGRTLAAVAGGLTSGIDLALYVVARYYGDDTARATADYMAYQSRRWMEESG